jgi:hypothetical protein
VQGRRDTRASISARHAGLPPSVALGRAGRGTAADRLSTIDAGPEMPKSSVISSIVHRTVAERFARRRNGRAAVGAGPLRRYREAGVSVARALPKGIIRSFLRPSEDGLY